MVTEVTGMLPSCTATPYFDRILMQTHIVNNIFSKRLQRLKITIIPKSRIKKFRLLKSPYF